MAVDLMKVRAEMFIKGITEEMLIEKGVDINRLKGGGLPCSQLTLLTEVLDTDRNYLCGVFPKSPTVKWIRTTPHFNTKTLRRELQNGGWSQTMFYSLISDRTNMQRLLTPNSNISLYSTEIMNVCFLLQTSYEYLTGTGKVKGNPPQYLTTFSKFVNIDRDKVLSIWKSYVLKTRRGNISENMLLQDLAHEVGVSYYYMKWLFGDVNRKTSHTVANKICKVIHATSLQDILLPDTHDDDDDDDTLEIVDDDDIKKEDTTPIWNTSMRGKCKTHQSIGLYSPLYDSEDSEYCKSINPSDILVGNMKEPNKSSLEMAHMMVTTAELMLRNEKLRNIINELRSLSNEDLNIVSNILANSIALIKK